LGEYFPWFIAVFLIAMALVICSNILAYVFRKPGVNFSVYMNGYRDEPALSGFFQMRRMMSWVREDKVKLVYWIAFAGAFLFMANILFGLVMAFAINPR
jgi:hypothetical protein